MIPDTLIENGILLVAMLGIMGLIIRGARPMRQGKVLHAHTLTFLRRYEDRSLWPSLIIGSLAVGTLIEEGVIGGGAIRIGFWLGLLSAVCWGCRRGTFVNGVLAVFCVLASVVEIANLPKSHADGGYPSILFAYGLLVVLTFCYFGGAFLAGRTKWISGRRALVYFGVVDIVAFLTSPGGIQVYTFDVPRRALYLALVCLACVVFGALDLDFVVVLTAAAMTLTGALITPDGLGVKTAVLITSLGTGFIVRAVAKKSRLVRKS